MTWSELSPIAVAVAIGLMIGFERERSHRGVHRQFAGTRTFAVLALAGALAALIGPAAIAVGLGAAALLVAVAYQKSGGSEAGSTTEVAALATYLLGALAHQRAGLAVAVGIILVGILMSKDQVHHLISDVVTDEEATDAVKFLVVAFVVLPLLPDRDMGPYGVLNPFRIWMLVVAIVGIGWIGYIGIRVFGPKRGLLVSGLAGGFVSATATTAAMGRLSREPDAAWPALAAALAASVSTMGQLVVVVAIASRAVVGRLWPAALAAAVVLGIEIVLVLRRAPVVADGEPEQQADPVRAFALRPAIILAAVITLTVLGSRWLTDLLGRSGAVLASAVAGLADGHAGAVAAASLADHGQLAVAVAVVAASSSIATNTAVKVVVALVAGGRSFGVRFAAAMVLPVAAFAVAVALT